MTDQKIKSVLKYLNHNDKNIRTKSLLKLKEYLSQGYNKKLIISKLRAYSQIENDEKLRAFSNKLIMDFAGSLQESKGKNKSGVLVLTIVFLFAVLILILFFLPEGRNEKNRASDAASHVETRLQVNTEISPKNSDSQLDEMKNAINLASASIIEMSIPRKFLKLQNFNNPVEIKFNPRRRDKFMSRLKIVQTTSSNSAEMSTKKLSFVLSKRVLQKSKNKVSVGVKVINEKGNAKSTFFGFPPLGKEKIFEILPNYTITSVRDPKAKRKNIQNESYMLPLPQLEEKSVSVGQTWGTKMINKKFGVMSQYKVDGLLNFSGKKKLIKISFLSVSESRGDFSNFHVDRKGVYFLDLKTGVIEYLKIHTISRTKLQGSGFPIENEVIMEQSLL